MLQLKGSLWDQNIKPMFTASKQMYCTLETYSTHSGENT